MKKKLWGIPAPLSGGGVPPTACGERDEPKPCGGARNSTRWDVPKSIESTEIVAFSCDFSAMYLMGESEVIGNAYTLTAEWKDGVVTGRYVRRSHCHDGRRHSFRAGREFLDRLQKLVAKHDLPQYNGLSYTVYGLPEDCGAYLSITYASGETVCASDNQDCFLPLEAMEDLERLFRQQAETGIDKQD